MLPLLSPHQLVKAKQKEPLKDCKIIEGDAEDLPSRADYASRNVSAGRYIPQSFAYWFLKIVLKGKPM